MTNRRSVVRRAFTLIEAALVTSIISVGVIAMLQLLATGTVSNRDGTDMTTGLVLAKNIRELGLGMHFADPSFTYSWNPHSPPNFGPEKDETLASFDDLDDLNGQTFSPPIDARRQVLTDFKGWEQRVVVQSVNPDWLTMAVPNGTSPALRTTVTIWRNGRWVCELSWLTFEPAEQ
jgi:hypothetical protein